MIKLENFEVEGFKPSMRGMRNPMNSWKLSDSSDTENGYVVGEADNRLASSLVDAGPSHRKFMRMINVYLDITAPLYWWKEFDTYKVGTVANSCSTMHRIHKKPFEADDFSNEQLDCMSMKILNTTIEYLNHCREMFNKTKMKSYWWQMIQLLPSSYNQKRTVMISYEALNNIYHNRKNHKLDEWREFCTWVESLPMSNWITSSTQE